MSVPAAHVGWDEDDYHEAARDAREWLAIAQAGRDTTGKPAVGTQYQQEGLL